MIKYFWYFGSVLQTNMTGVFDEHGRATLFCVDCESGEFCTAIAESSNLHMPKIRMHDGINRCYNNRPNNIHGGSDGSV